MVFLLLWGWPCLTRPAVKLSENWDCKGGLTSEEWKSVTVVTVNRDESCETDPIHSREPPPPCLPLPFVPSLSCLPHRAPWHWDSWLGTWSHGTVGGHGCRPVRAALALAWASSGLHLTAPSLCPFRPKGTAGTATTGHHFFPVS